MTDFFQKYHVVKNLFFLECTIINATNINHFLFHKDYNYQVQKQSFLTYQTINSKMNAEHASHYKKYIFTSKHASSFRDHRLYIHSHRQLATN
jgi:hypothetical protein